MQFKLVEAHGNEVILLERFAFSDHRGYFTKTFNEQMFTELGYDFHVAESLVSTSSRNVLRGMHLQIGEYACSKFISVIEGEVLDVAVKVDSPKSGLPVGSVVSHPLSRENSRSMLIPPNWAHGFLVTSEVATVAYHQSKIFNAASDTGVRFDSIDFEWPTAQPTVSEKDSTLPTLDAFVSDATNR